MKLALTLAAPAILMLPLGLRNAYAQGGGGAEKVRSYFIAADEVQWDYTPNGRNLTGLPHQLGAEDEGQSGTDHRVYRKAIFHEYTDATFTKLKPRTPDWEHLGILGPLIRAEVGDTVRVVFKNQTKLICSMHPHGLSYSKDSEGALYSDGTGTREKKDDMVQPGDIYTYTWAVPESAGPGPGDPSSVVWMYHSHFVEPKDMNTGLFGPIIVTARGQSSVNGRPKDVDREFVTAFAVFDESESWFFESHVTQSKDNLPLRLTDPVSRAKNVLYSINGFVEGNLPVMKAMSGERVRWYLLSNSNEDDIHTAHWHGQTALFNHMRTDTVSLNPMAMAVADMIPDKPGIWLYHCHVNDHLSGGMVGFFQVLPQGSVAGSGPFRQPR